MAMTINLLTIALLLWLGYSTIKSYRADCRIRAEHLRVVADWEEAAERMREMNTALDQQLAVRTKHTEMFKRHVARMQKFVDDLES